MKKLVLFRDKKELEIEADKIEVNSLNSPPPLTRANISGFVITTRGEKIFLETKVYITSRDEIRISLIIPNQRKRIKTFLEMIIFQNETNNLFFQKLFLFLVEKYSLDITITSKGDLGIKHACFLISSSTPMILFYREDEFHKKMIGMLYRILYGKHPSHLEIEKELILLVDKRILLSTKKEKLRSLQMHLIQTENIFLSY